MKLFEYQAKEVFRSEGIDTPDGVLIESCSELEDALKKTGIPCVLKSQILMGGRGKAGLVKLVKTSQEAYGIAKEYFKSRYNIKKILVEQAVDIEREVYLSITFDTYEATAIITACAEGGIDIESVAKNSSEKIITQKVDTEKGLMDFQARDMAYNLNFEGDMAKQVAKLIKNLYTVFQKYDAELVEINPIFVTKQNKIIAGDGKLSIDDNSMFRQKRYEKTREYFDSDTEYEASLEGIPYLQFNGDISLMCAGAGLTTTVYDLINYEGGTVANYLEFGGPNYKKAVKAMEICLKSKAKVILIVTFGTIARADVMAQGVVEAIENLKPGIPVVICIRGTNEEEAIRILEKAGLDPIYDTEKAVRKAVRLAAGGDR